jgi:hypothetical protein
MLSYREKCDKEFSYEQELMLTHKQVIMIYNKLCRHYKMPKIPRYRIKFTKRTNGSYCERTRVITLPKKKISLWIAIHELTHYYDHFKRNWIKLKRNERYHTKKLFTKEKRLMNYCRKKNYWGIDHGWKQYQNEGGIMSKEHYLERLEELKEENSILQSILIT